MLTINKSRFFIIFAIYNIIEIKQLLADMMICSLILINTVQKMNSNMQLYVAT